MTETQPHPWIERLRSVPMLVRAAIVVVVAPVVEYGLLVWISEQIGFTLTLLIVLGTGAVGTWFVRKQGLAAWERILARVRQGEPVGEAIFDAMLIVLAGVLLVMPGVLSDLVGFALLVKRSREWIKKRMSRWLRERAVQQVEAFRTGATISLRGLTETNGLAETNGATQPPAVAEAPASKDSAEVRDAVDQQEQTLAASPGS